MRCSICNSVNIYNKHNLFDDRYGYPEEYTLIVCRDCSHAYLDVGLTPDELEDLYTKYYPRASFNVDEHKPHKKEQGVKSWLNGTRSRACLWVPKNVRVLDIGCGSCESLGYYQVRGCEAYGIETDKNVCAIAKKYGYEVKIGAFDATFYEPNFFDYITLDQVIEHMPDPFEVFANISKVIRPGGTVILSTPNASGWGAHIFGKKWINWHSPYHLHFFSRESIRLVSENAGLKFHSTINITLSDWLNYQWFHLLSYPKKGTPSLFWSDNNQYCSKDDVSKKILRIAQKIKINHLITRFFDMFGIGDNKLYILKKE